MRPRVTTPNLLTATTALTAGPPWFATGGAARADYTTDDAYKGGATITAGSSAFGGIWRIASLTIPANVWVTGSVCAKYVNHRYLGMRISDRHDGTAFERFPVIDLQAPVLLGSTMAFNNQGLKAFWGATQESGRVRYWLSVLTEAVPGAVMDLCLAKSDGDSATAPAGTEQMVFYGASLQLGFGPPVYYPVA